MPATFQLRHFELMASTVAKLDRPQYGYLKRSTRLCVAEAFADMCAEQNPKFDRERFLKACGVES